MHLLRFISSIVNLYKRSNGMDIQKIKIDSFLDDHLTMLLYAADYLGDEDKSEKVLSAMQKVRSWEWKKSNMTVHPEAVRKDFNSLMDAIDAQYMKIKFLEDYPELLLDYDQGKVQYYDLYNIILKVEMDKIKKQKEDNPGIGNFFYQRQKEIEKTLQEIIKDLKTN